MHGTASTTAVVTNAWMLLLLDSRCRIASCKEEKGVRLLLLLLLLWLASCRRWSLLSPLAVVMVGCSGSRTIAFRCWSVVKASSFPYLVVKLSSPSILFRPSSGFRAESWRETTVIGGGSIQKTCSAMGTTRIATRNKRHESRLPRCGLLASACACACALCLMGRFVSSVDAVTVTVTPSSWLLPMRGEARQGAIRAFRAQWTVGRLQRNAIRRATPCVFSLFSVYGIDLVAVKEANVCNL